jgi:hypothetical protein
MPRRKKIAYKKSSATKVKKALRTLDTKGDEFYAARYAFAELVYNAGNTTEEAFCAAAKNILLDWHKKTRSPWGFHEQTYNGCLSASTVTDQHSPSPLPVSGPENLFRLVTGPQLLRRSSLLDRRLHGTFSGIPRTT